jgi:RNA polymerase sigma-70 factor, ECF subfamily
LAAADDAPSTGERLNHRQSTLHSENGGDRIKAMNSSAKSVEESEMISAILAGDIQLYHRLIRPYERSVYMMSLSCMKNERDAEDVAQETFVKAFCNLCTFWGESKFSTWLISFALNEARNRLRRQATTRVGPLDEPSSEDLPAPPALLRDWRALPSEVVERAEIRKLLHHAVESLPNIYQQVFLLRDVEDFNVNDTARILDINSSLVEIRLHRARIMLQRLLAPKLKTINSAWRGQVETIAENNDRG